MLASLAPLQRPQTMRAGTVGGATTAAFAPRPCIGPPCGAPGAALTGGSREPHETQKRLPPGLRALHVGQMGPSSSLGGSKLNCVASGRDRRAATPASPG